MSEATKDTIYIDVDDEITSIIDKLQASDKKIVALVLPKRATTLQSIVNMKLLKRAATTHKKNLVLITSEAALLPLAGAVGLHVAKTLQSKPVIPSQPEAGDEDIDLTPEEVDGAEASDDPDLNKEKSVGELAGMPDEDEDTIDVEPSAPETPAKADKKAGKPNKKLKVPNFEKFRTKVIIGVGALLLLIVLWYVGFFVLPKAKIVIKTDNLSVTADVDFTADTAVDSFDKEQGTVPATSKDVKKTDTEKAQATGKKDVGDKASGTASFRTKTSCESPAGSIAAGTTITSGGMNFVTQEGASFKVSGFEPPASCIATTASVRVVAANPGDQYNLSARDYAVSGYSGVTAKGSDMSGGTSKTVTVVSQADIDTLKAKLVDKSKDSAKEELKKNFQEDDLFALGETFANGEPTVTTSPAVGAESSDVSVTTVTTYTMLGVKRADLRTLVEEVAKKQIDASKQAISSDGLDAAVFRLVDKGNGKTQKLSVQTQVETGTRIDEDDLKKQIAGKKKGDARDLISKYPGVKDVTVNLSPFWVGKVPSKAKKVNIQFERPSASNSNDSNSQ